jgi:hypothetical protein
MRARVRAGLDALWKKTTALDDDIEAAAKAGLPHDDLLEQREKLRRSSWELAERGERLDLEWSELSVVDHRQPGARWRPTAAEPF